MKIKRTSYLNIKIVLGKPVEWDLLRKMAICANENGDEEVKLFAQQIVDFFEIEDKQV